MSARVSALPLLRFAENAMPTCENSTGTTSTGHEHTNTLQPLYSTSMAKHETAQQDQTKLERATILVSRHLSIEYGHNQRASMPTYLYPYRMFP